MVLAWARHLRLSALFHFPLKKEKHYFWLCWVFVAARSLPLVAVSRGYSLAAMRGLLIMVASLVEHRHESAQAWYLWRVDAAAVTLRV